jgi:hypothetical protein
MSSFPLRSAEIMEISMVAGWLVAPKVILVSVLCIIIIIMKSEHAYPAV